MSERELENRICNALSQGAKLELTAIAEKIGVSSSVVFRELQSLYQRQVIKQERSNHKLLWSLRTEVDPQNDVHLPASPPGAKVSNVPVAKRHRRTAAQIEADNEALRLKREQRLASHVEPTPVYADRRLPADLLFVGPDKETAEKWAKEHIAQIEQEPAKPERHTMQEPVEKMSQDQVPGKIPAGKKSPPVIVIQPPQTEISVSGWLDEKTILIRVKEPDVLSPATVEIPLALAGDLIKALMSMRDHLLEG